MDEVVLYEMSPWEEAWRRKIARLYSAYRLRYAERDERMVTMDQVVRGEFSAVDPAEESVESRSPNLIQVALEDTAEAAAVMPTIRVSPNKGTKTAKGEASTMERIAAGYFDSSKMDLLIPSTTYDLPAFGVAAWVVWPDRKHRRPVIEWRDPRLCYPEPGFRPGDTARNVIFARQVYFSQLPEPHQMKMRACITDPKFEHAFDENQAVTIVEYFDENSITTAALWSSSAGAPTLTGMSADKGPDWTPVILEYWEHGLGVCPVIVGARFSLDGEMRGQFDQVVNVLVAHIRLAGMVLDYADQAVYSDVWVRDLIGEMPYGGGAYIELGPQGAIGRVPPAVTSLNVAQDLEMLTDAIHVGGRWPKSRPGEIDQAIASAKFLEATAGMMNTAIKTYHVILRAMMEQALQVCFVMDKKLFPGKKTARGVLRNQEFVQEYDADDINLEHQVKVEYGLGLGRDPAQSAVLMLQYAGQGFISQEFVQENIEGVTDVARERARIDVEKFREMVLAKLLQGIEQGTIPEKALIKMAEDRANGKDIFDIFNDHVVKPKEELEASQIGSGLGPPVLPGMGPDGAPMPGAPPVPGAPGPGGGGPLPPPPPEAQGLLARLGVPAGPGGLLGAQQQIG